jgi:hypothetical protein
MTLRKPDVSAELIWSCSLLQTCYRRYVVWYVLTTLCCLVRVTDVSREYTSVLNVEGIWDSETVIPLTVSADTNRNLRLASHSGRFIPFERAHCVHWIRCWVGPIAGLDALEKREIFFGQAGNEPWYLRRPAHIPANILTEIARRLVKYSVYIHNLKAVGETAWAASSNVGSNVHSTHVRAGSNGSGVRRVTSVFRIVSRRASVLRYLGYDGHN